MKKVTKTVAVLIILFTLFISTPFTVIHSAIFNSNNTNAQITSSSTIKEFDTIEDAATYLRKKMVKREHIISFKINKPYYKSLPKVIFDKAVEDRKSSSSSEGDYLLANWNGYSANVKYGSNYSKITYNMKYLTTYKEEKAVDKQVKKILDDLNVYNKSDYTKIKAVHDYVVKNIHYDYNYKNRSSYNAIVNKKCVCQGFGSITYKMLKELDVGVRYVVGTANNTSHAWNIVKINSTWYNIDNTWDENSSNSNEISYKYFLKGSSDFYYHNRGDKYNTSSFKKAFPTAKKSYKKN